MRIISDEPDVDEFVFTQRPFAGALGASLYVGAGSSAAAINYRRNRIIDGAEGLIANLDGQTDLGAASFPKSQAVAQVASPVTELSYELPAELLEAEVWCQVRTFAGDYENDTIYRPRRLTTDPGGDPVLEILGVALIVDTQKRDGGGLRVLFAYTPSRDGLQPETFSVVQVTGPGTIAIGQVTAVDGQRDYTIDVEGLTDGGAYTFDLVAHSGAVDTVLVSGFAVTGDADGGAAVAGLVAEEY